MKYKISVLFICMGNICRSPTAEGVFNSIVKVQNLSDKIITDSAGTHAYHIGNQPDARAQVTAKNHGIDLSNLVARKVTAQDFKDFDYIIAMDNENLINLKSIQSDLRFSAKASVHLFMEFADNWQNDEVPDPYYDNGFEDVYRMVTDASQGLLKQILKDSNN
ncbi:MAG: low molecular weight protein-tyrosine-phosphatase [Cocleimonas sp.]